jgi:hypothetical protein
VLLTTLCTDLQNDFNHVLLTTLCTDLQNDFPHVTYLEGDTVPGAVLIILLENSLHFC